MGPDSAVDDLKSESALSLRAVVLLTSLCSCAATGYAAPASRFLAYTDQQAIVAIDNPDGIYPAAGFLQRPLVSQPRLFGDQPVVIANVVIAALDPAFVTTASCGDRSPTRLVVCLDPALTLSDADQLAVLAFTASPTAAFTRSTRVAAYLRSVLALSPDRLDRVRITDQNLRACETACERIIVLEK